MKIYLLDINQNIINAFKSEFSNCEDVEVVLDDFKHFMDTHKEVECIVSPAKYMKAGYEQVISQRGGLL